uniref:Uncharacterized protein n=1 Tax=Cannabis sativa TaxID=3483 RepID=A0A803Q7W5_CANSA
MARVIRSSRLPDECESHIAHFIRAKLTVPKSKNLDKARGGKVMEIEKPRHGAPKGHMTKSNYGFYFQEYFYTPVLLSRYITFQKSGCVKRHAPLIDIKRRAEAMLIDIPSWEREDNMSFLVAMASCLNLKRRILTLEETKPPVREVVQGILAASTALKKKVKKRSKTANFALPTHDSGTEKLNTVGTNERTPIDLSLDDSKHAAPNSSLDLACVSYAYTMDNKHKKVVELDQNLRVAEDQKKAYDLEESSRDALKKQTFVADDLRDKVKPTLPTCWKCFAIESNEEANFTINVGEPVLETSGVEGYNPERPTFPPSFGEAPLGGSEGGEETFVDAIGL